MGSSIYSPNNLRRNWNRFVRVNTDTNCWEWLGPKKQGTHYGKASGKHAHRRFYEAFVGDIPTGLVIHHKCENEICCNPKHLVAVTIQENLSARKFRVATSCINGHEYTKENTIISKRGDGRPVKKCRTCAQAYDRKRARLAKEKGFCPSCLVNKPDIGYVTCRICIDSAMFRRKFNSRHTNRSVKENG